MKHFYLGGVRSGKSKAAQCCASEQKKKVCYIATAEALDDGMQNRIRMHQKSRPAEWHVIEEPIQLADAILRHAMLDTVVLVECLTLWLSNLLCKEDEALFLQQRQLFMEALAQVEGDVIMVSNEVGLGIMPMNSLARRFADEAGCLNQEVASLCEKVTLISAGLPLQLKP